MVQTTQKREAGLLDATPEKRMYWSIISDYDLRTGLCELIDNAFDQWVSVGRRRSLSVDLKLDAERQLIELRDSAGGVKEEHLRVLVAPGASINEPTAETIGIFGVGSKRAVIALAESIQIRTRARKSKGFQIDIDNSWLKSPDWNIPHFEIPDVEEGATEISLSALRKTFDSMDVANLGVHLGQTYARFLRGGDCRIRVNGIPSSADEFDNWAYPRGFEPQRTTFEVELEDREIVRIEITAGLVRDRDPVAENYGVYFYCNDRLIAKELRVRDVGYFVTAEAGVPHPDASLCRAIVRLNGPAKWMPWNSSKSAINFAHPVLQRLRPTLIRLVSYFSSLSRRLKDDWDGKVFRWTAGEIQEVESDGVRQGKRLVLPPLPRMHTPHIEVLKAKNRNVLKSSPWTLGLVESIAAVDIIGRQKLETRNRIALILLDSSFEIGLKEFIAHRTDLFPLNTTNISQLFQKRHNVVAAVAAKIDIDQGLLEKAQHYYGLRNKLVHERATVEVLESDVANYKGTVEKILNLLFKLKF
jgi:hypothetical protein